MERLKAIVATRGVFLTAEANEVGYDHKSIARAVRAKLWVRVRHGAYTFSETWQQADEAERHRIRCAGVMTSLGDNVALSHTSAAIAHGLRVWNADLSRVHVTRLDGGAGRTEGDVVHHEGLCLDEDIERRHGHYVMNAPRAALETASLLAVEPSLVVIDSVMNLGKASAADLEYRHALMQSWPGSQHLHIALKLADAGSESVGESRARYLCWAHDLPAPTTQFEVRDAHGRLIGTTDFAWPEYRLLGEFDGKVKYGRLLLPGDDPTEAVFREKRREDALREALIDWALVRLIWADLYAGRRTAARIMRLLHRAG